MEKTPGRVTWGKDADGVERWHTRVRELDGSEPRRPIDASWATDPGAEAKAKAKAVAAHLARGIRQARAVPRGTGLTFREWLEDFHKDKEARGRTSVADMQGRAEKWYLPRLGHLPIAKVTREDVEAVVKLLDGEITKWHRAGGKRGSGLSPSSAANIWGDLQHAFSEATNAKDRALRVLQVNPCEHVRGPDTGDDREGPILYSAEVVALLAGKAMEEGARDVPLYRRRVYALALYTAARRSELAGLTVTDVDLVNGTITISKQATRKGTETRPTKTRKARTIDIEPHVRALVELLCKHPEGREGRLVRVPPSEDCAELLRADLWTVGARRPELHESDAARTAVWFHHTRDTHLTMMATRGDSPIAIQWRGGHTDFKTTQGYLSRGQTEARRIGVPLPPIPASILAGPEVGQEWAKVPLSSRSHSGNVATPTGIEPVLPT